MTGGMTRLGDWLQMARTRRAVVCVLMIAACHGGKAAELSHLSEPYMAEFAAFDRWVLRATEGEGGFGFSPAWKDALFAKLRLERNVVAAWVERPGKDLDRLSYGAAEIPSGLVWTRLQKQGFERVYAARAMLRQRGKPRDCIVIRHDRNHGPAVSVAVAYRLSTVP